MRGFVILAALSSANSAGLPDSKPQVRDPFPAWHARPASVANAGDGIEGLAPDGGAATWEEQFKWGLHHSKLALEDTADTSGWVLDPNSGAAVPLQILHAEELLLAGVLGAPEGKINMEKNSERALRLYHHAKWLAERSYAKSAEWRYREAAQIAKSLRRSVLAAHALSRLGYFLMYWNRRDEARDVLAESEMLNRKSNALAPFLIGVLDRQAAGNDLVALLAAEDRILTASDQPSKDLEAERTRLVSEIQFWRAAEQDPRQCVNADYACHVLICFLGHAFYNLRKFFIPH